jgi:hypothetical protein
MNKRMLVIDGTPHEGVDMPEMTYNKIMAKFREGDSRCRYTIGSRVMTFKSEPDSRHRNGHKGTVKGSLYLESERQDGYLVLFDGDAEEVCVTGDYITEENL